MSHQEGEQNAHYESDTDILTFPVYEGATP